MRALADIEKDGQSAFNLLLQATGLPPVGLTPQTLVFDTQSDTLYFLRGAQLREIKLKSKAV